MRTIRMLASAGVSLLAIASPAMAQDTAAKDSEETGFASNEIVVQARRREESVQQVPVVVQAVTAENIAQLNLRKAEDITSVVPGLALTPNANGIGSVNTLRGVNFDVNISGNSATVEFYYNGAPISSNAVLQSLFDVGQIEVLRGPQGTLQGRASPSGSINFTVRRPDLSEAGGYANMTANDINGWNINGALNIPVIQDKLGVRIAGVVSDDQGSRVRPAIDGGRLNNASQGIRASVAADPFDGILKLDFTYQGFERRSLQYTQVQSFTDNPYFNEANPNSPLTSPIFIRARDRDAVQGNIGANNRQTFNIYNWQAQLSLWGQRLTYLGGHLKQNLIAFDPGDDAGIFLNQYAPLGLFSNNPAAPILTGVTGPFGQPTDTMGKTNSHEVRLQNEERVLDMFDYVVGYLSYSLDTDTHFNRVVGAVATPAPPARPTTIQNIQYLPLQRYGRSLEQSVFGNVTAHLGEATELSGGLRRIWYRTDAGLRVGGVDQPNQRTCAGYSSVTGCDPQYKATIYSASLSHRFTEDVMVYASYGSSWRAPTIVIGGPTQSLARPMSDVQAQFQSTDAETSDSYEIGIKSDWLDNTLRVNVTGFYQKFKNYPYRNITGVFSIVPTSFDTAANACVPAAQGGCRVEAPQYVSAVPVTVKGVETEVVWRPSDRFNLSAILTYTDGKIKGGQTPCTDLNGDGQDDRLFSAPSATALVAAVGSDFVSVCNISQRANASPPWAGSLQAEYNHPLSDSMEGYLRGLYTWKGKSQGEPSNPVDQIKAYGLLNMFLGIRDPDGAWDLSLYGKNITNTFRVLTNTGPQTTATLSHGTLSYTNYYGITVTDPREFGLNLRFAFGSR